MPQTFIFVHLIFLQHNKRLFQPLWHRFFYQNSPFSIMFRVFYSYSKLTLLSLFKLYLKVRYA